MERKGIKAPSASCYRLPIDIGTELHMEIVDVSSRFKSSVIGMQHNRYIIVKTPEIVADDFEEKCARNKGAKVIGKFQHVGSIFGFETNLLGIITNPASLMFVIYPLKVEEKNTRKEERINCLLPGKLIVMKNVKSVTVVSLNSNGCLISINCNTGELEKILAVLAKTKNCELSLQLPGESKGLLIESVIKGHRINDATLNLGLQFLNIGSELKYTIDRFINLALSFHS